MLLEVVAVVVVAALVFALGAIASFVMKGPFGRSFASCCEIKAKGVLFNSVVVEYLGKANFVVVKIKDNAPLGNDDAKAMMRILLLVTALLVQERTMMCRLVWCS